VDDAREPAELGADARSSAAPKALLVAIALLALQSLGLLVAAAVLVVKTVDGHPDSVGRSLFGVVFALGAAALLMLAARGLLAAKRAARTPVLVVEILAIPVGYSLAFQAHRFGYGLPVLVGAIAVIALIFSPGVNRLIDAA